MLVTLQQADERFEFKYKHSRTEWDPDRQPFLSYLIEVLHGVGEDLSEERERLLKAHVEQLKIYDGRLKRQLHILQSGVESPSAAPSTSPVEAPLDGPSNWIQVLQSRERATGGPAQHSEAYDSAILWTALILRTFFPDEKGYLPRRPNEAREDHQVRCEQFKKVLQWRARSMRKIFGLNDPQMVRAEDWEHRDAMVHFDERIDRDPRGWERLPRHSAGADTTVRLTDIFPERLGELVKSANELCQNAFVVDVCFQRWFKYKRDALGWAS